jgi:hypothetical protein
MSAPVSKGQPVFSPLLLVGVVILAIGAFVLSLYLATREEHATDGLGPSSYSRSAIGYAGLVEVLRKLGIPVVQSRYNSLKKAGGAGMLFVAEPRRSEELDKVTRALVRGRKVLLVLPKWTGKRNPARSGWLAEAVQRPALDAQSVLDFVVQKALVYRQPSVDKWTVNGLNQAPDIHGPVQLIKSDRLRPIVASDKGVLVGELTANGRRIWVLSDPDAISNHGLGKPGNPVFAVALINGVRGGQGKVVFDETIHGFLSQPASPLRMLFQFPFYIVALQGAAAIGLLLWASMGRFGTAASAPAALSVGKQELVDNVARLMGYAGHHKVMIHRYIHSTVRDAARQIHAPRNLDGEKLVEWLQRAGNARGVRLDCAELLQRADRLIEDRRSSLGAFVALARNTYRWKREIIDGPSRDPKGDRSHSR